MIEDNARPGIIRANAYFLIAGAGLILLNFVAPVLLGIVQRLGIEITQTGLLCLLDIVYYVPCILIPIGLYAWRGKGGGLRLGSVSIKQTLQCLAAAYFCVMLANSLAAVWSILLEWMGFTLYSTEIVMNNENDLLKAVFAVAVLPGICEELLFRGVVLGAYERGGTRKAILVSSILFASLHGSVQGFPVQLVIGIILGFAACSTGSIYVGMMIHTAYNAILLIMSYLMRGIDAGEYNSIYESIGGISGMVTVVIEMLISAALLFVILRSFARQGEQTGEKVYENSSLHMGKAAVIILAAGLAAVSFLYGQDIMLLLGYQI